MMSFNKKLIHYLNKWEEKQIISSTQKGEILRDIQHESSSGGFLKILGTIGALCIGAGVLLIIAGNWSGFPKTFQLLLSLALPIVSLILAYYFSYIQVELKKVGQAFALLGGLMIGASIALVGQIYHLDGTVGRLLLMWFILLLPVIYVFKLKTLGVLATGLFYGICYYYLFEVFFTSWRDHEYILASFTLISSALTLIAYISNKVTQGIYKYLFYPVAGISLKVLFFVLFLATTFEELIFIGSGFGGLLIHNLLFLGVIFATMYWANKNYEILLRHATFVWFGIWFAWKYFDLVGSYMQGGMFFVMSGIVLIGFVYSVIKINKKLGN